MLPAPSLATPSGPLKRALAPVASALPGWITAPAIVVTVPVAMTTLRIVLSLSVR